jgi:plastocyanin
MIMNYQYSPAAVTIAAEDTVTWTNHDTAPHNVVVILAVDQYVLTHTVWLETVLAPLAGQLTC